MSLVSGTNPRYVVTHPAGGPKVLYDDLYCQCGEAANRIKQAQVALFATRTSCQCFRCNQLRVLLATVVTRNPLRNLPHSVMNRPMEILLRVDDSALDSMRHVLCLRCEGLQTSFVLATGC